MGINTHLINAPHCFVHIVVLTFVLLSFSRRLFREPRTSYTRNASDSMPEVTAFDREACRILRTTWNERLCLAACDIRKKRYISRTEA